MWKNILFVEYKQARCMYPARSLAIYIESNAYVYRQWNLLELFYVYVGAWLHGACDVRKAISVIAWVVLRYYLGCLIFGTRSCERTQPLTKSSMDRNKNESRNIIRWYAKKWLWLYLLRRCFSLLCICIRINLLIWNNSQFMEHKLLLY